jgi:hypothetical protein
MGPERSQGDEALLRDGWMGETYRHSQHLCPLSEELMGHKAAIGFLFFPFFWEGFRKGFVSDLLEL